MIFPKIKLQAVNGHDYTEYSDKDVNMVSSALWRTCRVVNEMLEREGISTDEALKDMTVEFTSMTDHPELKKYGAIGLSFFQTPNRNINYMPRSLSRSFLALYSGTMSMELCHSIVWTISKNTKIANDIVHWCYNENHLIKHTFASHYNLKAYGGALTLVIPDIVLAWKNREEIIEGIKSGKYIVEAGEDPYWTRANKTPASFTAATPHELEKIKNFLITGDTRKHV